MMYIGALQTFLKFVIGVNVVGLLTKVGFDLYEWGVFDLLFKKVGGLNRMKIVDEIEWGKGEHVTVLGLTRHGKTFAVMHTLKYSKEGVLFFNVQQEKTPSNFIKANGNNSFGQISKLLKEGKKINYIPSDDLEKASKELSILINEIYSRGSLNCRIAIDEVHLFSSVTKDKSALKALIRLSTTGLRFGYQAIFLSQRPAKIENTLLTQSTKHIIFALGKLDESYLKTNGFPLEDIVSKTKNEKYHFVIFDQKEIKGAFKIRA